MKNISSIVKKTILPLALSSIIFLNGCGKKENGEEKSIRNFFKIKNPGETEYIEYEKKLIFDEKDFKKENGQQIYCPICYDIESKKKISIDDEFSKNAKGNNFLEMFTSLKNKLIEENYDFSISPHYYGVSNLIFPEYNTRDFLFFGKDDIWYNKNGELMAERILEKIPKIKYDDIRKVSKILEKGEEEPHLTFIKTRENNYYLLKQTRYREEPPKMEFELYKLKNSKIPSYSKKLPMR